MRHVARLATLQRLSEQKLKTLERRTANLIKGKSGCGLNLSLHLRESELNVIVIGFQTFWNNWCRALYISSALGATTARGTPIAGKPNLINEQDAIAAAIQAKRGGKLPTLWRHSDEPKWFAPSDFLKVAVGVGLSNESQLSAVFSTRTTYFDDLRIIRNYFAHRCQALQSEVTAIAPRYLLSSLKRPSDLLMHVEPGSTATVLERWLIHARRVAYALCQ